MSNSIRKKPSKKDLKHTFRYLIANPLHLFELDEIELRYLQKLIHDCLQGFEDGIENLMSIGTIDSDGNLQPVADYYPDEVLEIWSEMIGKRIEELIGLSKESHSAEEKNSVSPMFDSSLQPIKQRSFELTRDLSGLGDKMIKLSYPVIALFCRYVNESKLVPKSEDETVKAFCIRICKKFELKYADNVRQHYPARASPYHTKQLKELLLPTVNEEARGTIIKYIDSQNRKLYG